MFERETRREKILEARNRELKLKKAKAAGEHDEGEVNLTYLKFFRKFGQFKQKNIFLGKKERRSTRIRSERSRSDRKSRKRLL